MMSDSGATSTTRARNTLINSIKCGRDCWSRKNFDEGQVAIEQRALGNIFREEHIDELFEAGFKAMRAFFVGVRDDGHPGDLGVFRWADGE